MKYYIIAGEASGDLHASNLMKYLKKYDDKPDFRIWGGEKMESYGGKLVKHYKELAFMGFLEVFLNLNTIIKNINFCKKDILQYEPNVVILVDYPGFNLRIAKFLKNKNIKVVYYISPQIWAWKESRINIIKRCVDKMIVILPFEEKFYNDRNYKVDYVGHPLTDVINNFSLDLEFKQKNSLSNKPIIALLPGSRKQEIVKILPLMISLIKEFYNFQFVIAASSNIDSKVYQNIIGDQDVKLVLDSTYDLLSYSDFALVTSGTATLETALFKTPQIVCYKGSFISYFIGKLFVKVKYIALVNLILNKECVKELIQDQLTKENLSKELNNLINDDSYKDQINQDYEHLNNILGSKGASSKAAEIIYDILKS